MKTPTIEQDEHGNALRLTGQGGDDDSLFTIFYADGEPAMRSFWDPNFAAKELGIGVWDLLSAIENEDQATAEDGRYCRIA